MNYFFLCLFMIRLVFRQYLFTLVNYKSFDKTLEQKEKSELILQEEHVTQLGTLVFDTHNPLTKVEWQLAQLNGQ